jgi:2-dehydropantoate 2-reductase
MSVEPAEVAVIGPGAVGGAFAAAAIQAGRTVVVGARTPFDRLHVEFPDVTVDAAVDVLTDPAAARPAPIVLLATKTHQTAKAKPWLDAFTERGSVVAALQNGVDHRPRVDPLLPPGAISVPAIVVCGSTRTAPGTVRVGGEAQLFVPTGQGGQRLEEAMAGSVARINQVDDWATVAWTKLMTNAAMGAIGVLTRRDNRVFADRAAADLTLGLMEETAAVGRAEGADLPPGRAAELLALVMDRAGAHTSSIVVDRAAGRPTEWRDRNDVVVRRADEHGIDVPLSRLVTTLLRLGEPERTGH